MKVALAGDTMLGRMVGDRLRSEPWKPLFSDGVVEVLADADLVVANLECAISDRGQRWPNAAKPFFFRAPPAAADHLAHLGVDCVTLANNHALDYGPVALLDTIEHLHRVGISCVGAGPDVHAARTPALFERNDTTVAVVGVTDHPAEFAAGDEEPGVAFADLRHGTPAWLRDTIASAPADVVLVSPHWGPNLEAEPVDHVRRAAAELRAAGATLVAGHSAHVFHGVTDRILFDLGGFIDDYAVDPRLRNDLGLLFTVHFDGATPLHLEATPIALDHCMTRLADPTEARIVADRFRMACAAFETPVQQSGDRLVIDWTGQLVA
jgi:poly-gamma-glutamate synthesis protein (capsule biosynthesis protein)